MHVRAFEFINSVIINSVRRVGSGNPAICFTLMVVCVFATSCSILPNFGKNDSEKFYELKLKLSASSDTNLDAQSRPSPVQVRVFLTDAQSDIKTESFEAMFDFQGLLIEPRPESIVTMNPEQTLDLTLPANKSQTLIIIAAGFRDPYQSVWKASTLLTPKKTVEVSATIGASTVTIQPLN